MMDNLLFLSKLRELCIEYGEYVESLYQGYALYHYCENKLLGTNGLQKPWILPEDTNGNSHS